MDGGEAVRTAVARGTSTANDKTGNIVAKSVLKNSLYMKGFVTCKAHKNIKKPCIYKVIRAVYQTLLLELDYHTGNFLIELHPIKS